jgi:hypothetical protein
MDVPRAGGVSRHPDEDLGHGFPGGFGHLLRLPLRTFFCDAQCLFRRAQRVLHGQSDDLGHAYHFRVAGEIPGVESEVLHVSAALWAASEQAQS